MLRAVLVDDSADLRQLTRITLEDDGTIEIIGEAEDALGGLDLIEELLPDVAIIDVHMPGMDGVELIASLRNRAATTRLVAYSSDGGGLTRALQAGADAAVLKTGLPDELRTAMS